MPTLTITIPTMLEAAFREAVLARGTSPDNLIGAALSEYLQSHQHRIFQISTSTALVEGVDQGAISSRVLLDHGNFGLGTFERFDGEMVIVDGEIYQVRADGTVQNRRDDFCVPFAVVLRFTEEISFEVEHIRSLKELDSACDRYRESKNLFHAFRLDGTFQTMHTRAVGSVAAGTRLGDAAKTQKEFHFSDVEGTLVCIWSPSYSSAFNVPGYHFHFLSKDRTKGGHVLNCSAEKLKAGAQMLCEYDVQLPTEGRFLTTNLDKDPTAELAKTE
jgi:acetolactate decarboxylase